MKLIGRVDEGYEGFGGFVSKDTLIFMLFCFLLNFGNFCKEQERALSSHSHVHSIKEVVSNKYEMGLMNFE